MKIKDYSDILKDVSLFKNINKKDIPAFFENIPYAKRSYSCGEAIIRRGELCRYIGIVISGTAHVIYSDFWGNSNIIAEIGTKDIFAETYAVLGKPLDIDVVAATNSEIIFCDISKIPSDPIYMNFTHNLISVLAEKNLRLNKKVRHISQRTTREKLISYLSSEAVKSAGETFEIPFDRQQLADYLSVERSAMSAELSKMRKDGIIDFKKNKFYLKKNNPE